MLKTAQKIRRNTVTVEDRRAVMVLAKSRKPKDIALVKHEDFVRRELKSRLGWPQSEPASDALKTAAREIAQAVARELKAAADAKAAKLKAEAEAKAKAETEKSLGVVEGA